VGGDCKRLVTLRSTKLPENHLAVSLGKTCPAIPDCPAKFVLGMKPFLNSISMAA
jgi:hypothetical protein